MAIDRFGRYRIKKKLGQGGMSVVYHAFDPSFGRDVAIKVLPRETLIYPQFRRRFEREAKAIAYLEHPAIVPVYDFGEEDGQPYIVMRYMSGGSLTDRLKFGPIDLEEVVKIITRLAPALDAAHSRGIVHRDIKPDNILFDQYSTVFLSDFGLAHLKESTGLISQTDPSIMGTPAYMSPEQVQGDRELDGRSDIYSLGVVLYQMLTGSMPYVGNTPASIMMMHLLNPVPKIRDRNVDLPPALEAVIESAMAKDPEARYPNAHEMAQAIESAIQSSRVTSADPLKIGSRQEASAPTHPVAKPWSRFIPTALNREELNRLRQVVPRWVWVVSMLMVISVLGTITVGSSLVFSNFQNSGTSSPTSTLRILISNVGSTSPTPFFPSEGTKQAPELTSLSTVSPTMSSETDSQSTETSAGGPIQPQATEPPPPQPTDTRVQPSATRRAATPTEKPTTPTSASPPTHQPTATRKGPLPSPTEPPAEPTQEPPTPTAPP